MSEVRQEVPTVAELDRLVAGELDPPEAARVQALADRDPEASDYLAARRAEQEALLERLPPAVLVARAVEAARRPEARAPRRPAGPAWRSLRLWAPLIAVAAAAAVVLLLVLPSSDPPGPGVGSAQGNDLVWMGSGAAVRLHVQRDGEVLTGGTPQIGDRVRFELLLPPGETAYAAVLTVQGGRTTAVLPSQGPAFEVVESGLLPGAIELAPGGGPADVLLVARPESFDAGELAAEMQRGGGNPAGLALRFTVELGP